VKRTPSEHESVLSARQVSVSMENQCATSVEAFLSNTICCAKFLATFDVPSLGRIPKWDRNLKNVNGFCVHVGRISRSVSSAHSLRTPENIK
jgi:hypothetical protein